VILGVSGGTVVLFRCRCGEQSQEYLDGWWRLDRSGRRAVLRPVTGTALP